MSWKLAKTSGKWVGRSDSTIHRHKVAINVAEFQEWCDKTRNRYETLTQCVKLRERAIVITYEDLATSSQSIMSGTVFPFLDVDPLEVTTQMRKQNPRSLQECVENYDEVQSHLASNRLELSLGHTS
ncbi:hypothetical protein JCM17478_35820 [Thermopirellula anaerolimosa]